ASNTCSQGRRTNAGLDGVDERAENRPNEAKRKERRMAWSIEGRYFENCSCEVVCPCTASLALGAGNDYCRFALAFHGDKGQVEVDEVVSFGSESGEPAKLTDIFHPAGTTLTVAKATDASGVNAFGLELGGPSKSRFSARFAWSG